MAHARKQIRDAAAGVLTGLSLTGSNVYTNHVYNLTSSKLPAIIIHTLNDTPQQGNTELGTNNTTRWHILEMDIEIRGIATDIDDSLDAVAADVEAAMANNRTLSGNVIDSELTGSELEVSSDSERPTGQLTLSYSVMYCINDRNPETLLT
jgi:hypothetical protein